MPTDDEHLKRIEAALMQPELEAPPLVRRRVRFRLGRMPSRRATSEAWVVVGPTIRGQDSHPIVREVRVDRVALAQGSPDAILVRDSALTSDAVEAWMNELRAIRIPIGGVEEHMGLDGTSYTLHVEAGMATASLRWWHDGPEAWSELTAWARRTMTELRARVG